MSTLDEGISHLLRQSISYLAINDPDDIVQRRLTRLKTFARPSLGDIASKFENAIALTERCHAACEALRGMANKFFFEEEAIWAFVHIELDANDEQGRQKIEAIHRGIFATTIQARQNIRCRLMDAIRKKQPRSEFT
jgi:hypothetical protein